MTLRGHEGEVMDMQVHPDNTLLASCDDKKMIRIWSLSSGATLTGSVKIFYHDIDTLFLMKVLK